MEHAPHRHPRTTPPPRPPRRRTRSPASGVQTSAILNRMEGCWRRDRGIPDAPPLRSHHRRSIVWPLPLASWRARGAELHTGGASVPHIKLHASRGWDRNTCTLRPRYDECTSRGGAYPRRRILSLADRAWHPERTFCDQFPFAARGSCTAEDSGVPGCRALESVFFSSSVGFWRERSVANPGTCASRRKQPVRMMHEGGPLGAAWPVGRARACQLSIALLFPSSHEFSLAK